MRSEHATSGHISGFSRLAKRQLIHTRVYDTISYEYKIGVNSMLQRRIEGYMMSGNRLI